MQNQPFANIPGVKYPAPKPEPRPALPKGCPRYLASYRLLAPWICAAGLWPKPPGQRTMERWAQYGLIAFKRGATGCRMIDVAATLARLSPNN